jgi:hypothetical protein
MWGLAAFAQTNSSITGTVSDIEGKKLGNVAIQVRNPATGSAFSAQSAADGSYTVAGLAPGTYELIAIVPGMIPNVQPNLKIDAAKGLKLDLHMEDLNANTLGEDRGFYANMFSPSVVATGPAPRMPDGKPDLSGVWRPSLPSEIQNPEMLPAAAELFKARNETHGKDIPTARCMPGGMVLATIASPYKIVQTQNLIVILFDEGDLPRQIFLDGRPHPKEMNPTWVGHSVGRWEGDTLVVDSVGFNDKAWIGPFGYPQTEKMHMTERYHRVDKGHLELQFTFEDPGAYAKPWVMKKVSALAPPGEEVEENVCMENNRDVEHLVGK